MNLLRPNTLIAGIGSPHGDDQIGWHLAQSLSVRLGAAAAVRLCAIPADLLEMLAGVDQLIVCDACQGSGPPGSLHRWEWPHLDIVHDERRGSHGVSLHEILKVAEALDRLPRSVAVWTVEGFQYEPGQSISSALLQRIVEITDSILHREFPAKVDSACQTAPPGPGCRAL